ncbi:uncharacterized protein ZBIST_4922 [Zygosaccharomyces bailii]|nr:uncharacterized protein ZBIST_4922 [Zygosaccharomyces bailii]
MRKRFALSVALPTALLLVFATWIVLFQSRSTSDLGLPKFIPLRESKEKITWRNFQDKVRPIDLENSTAIFNSIYAALRQSGSDLHPVGVTYFPAIIPKGTLLFHAGKGEMPEGLEWLAMDHEFSLNFGSRRQAYGRRSLSRRGKGPGGPGGSGKPGGPPGSGKQDQSSDQPKKNFDRSGSMTMMTFRATRDLNRFLYLDGASASKSTTGEMDTQKMISDLVGSQSNSTSDGDNGKRVMSERLYAERICSWGKKYGLEGIVRVEVGFELVLCDFLDGSTELVSNNSYPLVNDMLGLPPPTKITAENGWPLDANGTLIEDQLTEEQRAILKKEDDWETRMRKFDTMDSFGQLLAGEIHDKGDRRIHLDYRHMVTGLNRTYINPDPNNRRLLNDDISLEVELGMLHDLENSLRGGFDSSESTDWQQVLDEIVDKFSPMLKGMERVLDAEDKSVNIVAENITRYTTSFVRRFIEKQEEGSKLGSGRDFAIYQYSRPLKDLATDSDYLIWSAVVRVVTEVVDTIYSLHETLWPIVLSEFQGDVVDDAYSRVTDSQQRLKGLIKALNWIPLNFECEKKCDWDEVCYTPSWGPSPLGWALPDSTDEHFGMHFDSKRQRQVIDSELRCVKIDSLL